MSASMAMPKDLYHENHIILTIIFLLFLYNNGVLYFVAETAKCLPKAVFLSLLGPPTRLDFSATLALSTVTGWVLANGTWEKYDLPLPGLAHENLLHTTLHVPFLPHTLLICQSHDRS